MTSGRFIFIIVLLVLLVGLSTFFQMTPWRVGALILLGCVPIISFAFSDRMAFFLDPEAKVVGEEVQKCIISVPRHDSYYWAGENLPFDECCKHFITIGATGAGKSIVLNFLMQSVVSKLGRRETAKLSKRRRAVVYDSKTDLVSVLSGMAPEAKLRIFNPLDERFAPWDVSADIVTETDAYEFASILIPKNEKESTPYFGDAARALIAGVIKRFNSATQSTGGYWTLRDLILAFQSKKRLQDILSLDITSYLHDHFDKANAKNFAGVKSTVDNTLALYRPIAALFDSAKQPRFSLKTWLSEESILVLGNHESAREATDTLNRLLFRQLSKMLIARHGRIENDETWIFLDELREAGVLPGLRQLLLRGRSKGVAVALGFQDVEGIYAAYGEHDGAEIIGATQNAMVLHINPTAPSTAKWASSVFGSRRDLTPTMTTSVGTNNQSSSASQQLSAIENVLPIEFTQLKMPSEKEGLYFYSFTNTQRFRAGIYPWSLLQTAGPLNVRGEKPDFVEVTDAGRFKLRPWDPDDVVRLDLGNVKPVPAAPAVETEEVNVLASVNDRVH